jgi:hypothetical protein
MKASSNSLVVDVPNDGLVIVALAVALSFDLAASVAIDPHADLANSAIREIRTIKQRITIAPVIALWRDAISLRTHTLRSPDGD